jgi:hypothetical protein
VLLIKIIKQSWLVKAKTFFVIFEYSFVEEIFERRGVCKRHAEDLQDLIGASVQMHIVLYDGNKTVGADGGVDLYPDSVLGSAPEPLDFEVLLEPLEEKFYLPSVLVEVGDLRGCQFECVGKEHELTALLLIEEPHKPQMFGISFPTVRESQLYLGISQYPIG